MGAGELLQRLDRRVLPLIGHVLEWSLGGVFRRRVAISTGVLAGTALLAASVWAAHEPPAGPRDVGDLVRVGVGEGQSVDSYASEAGRELEDLARGEDGGASYALVSFTAYLAPGRFIRVLGDAPTYRAYARVPLPNSATNVSEITIQRMPADLTAGMARVADRKSAEAKAYRSDADKLTGSSDVERDRRERYRAIADALDAESRAYQVGCSCLFAAVVRASASELDRLADTPGVRTVDPAPEVTALERAIFMPPLPENTGNSQPEPSPSTSPARPSESHSGSSTPSDPPDASPSSPGASPSEEPSPPVPLPDE